MQQIAKILQQKKQKAKNLSCFDTLAKDNPFRSILEANWSPAIPSMWIYTILLPRFLQSYVKSYVAQRMLISYCGLRASSPYASDRKLVLINLRIMLESLVPAPTKRLRTRLVPNHRVLVLQAPKVESKRP